LKNTGDLFGLLIINFSEFLVIMPFLLRSLRIQKMFQAREIYYNDEKLPESMIKRWRERRVMLIYFAAQILVSGVLVTIGLLGDNYWIPNYNNISSVIRDENH
jgi:hypothetical protein